MNKAQLDVRDNQIQELQRRLEDCEMESDVIFKHDIVRVGKRINDRSYFTRAQKLEHEPDKRQRY